MRHSLRALSVIVPLAAFVMIASLVFAILDETLLRPVPGTSGGAFVSLRFATSERSGGFGSYASLPTYRRAAAPAGLLALGASCCHERLAMTAPGFPAPLPVVGDFVTSGYFAALGVRPLLGRLLADEEADVGAERVGIVSEFLWRRRFGADPDLVGRSVGFNGVSFKVVGITAAFRGWSLGDPDGHVDVWLPLTNQRDVTGSESSMSVAVGRLRRASDRAGAEARLQAAQLQMQGDLSARARLFHPVLEHGLWPLNVDRSATTTIVTLLTWFVALLGALACANAASNIMTQISKRRREIAVRLALGASRWQVSWPLLKEVLQRSATIMLIGATASALLLSQLTDIRLAAQLPALRALTINWRILAFSGLATLLTVTLATILPLAATVRSDIRRDLWDSSRTTGRHRWPHAALLAIQLAASAALLASALTLGISLHGLVSADLGIDPASVFEISVDPSPFGFTAEQSSTVVNRFLEDLRQSGFSDVATSSPAPLETMLTRISVRSETAAAVKSVAMTEVSVGGNYFSVLKLRILSGRALSGEDQTRDGVAPIVISESLATSLLGESAGAVGRVLSLDRSGGGSSWQNARIVGVAADVRSGPRSASYPAIYHRLPSSLAGVSVLVRSEGPVSKALSSIEASANRANPVAALFDIRLLNDKLTRRLSAERTLASVTGVMTPIAILVAFAGIVTIVAQLVRDRHREFAIRSVLGASPSVLSRLVVRSLLMPISIGILVGLVAYAGSSRLLGTYAFGVKALQPSVLIGAAGIMISLAFLTALLRGLQATRHEPAEGLRLE